MVPSNSSTAVSGTTQFLKIAPKPAVTTSMLKTNISGGGQQIVILNPSQQLRLSATNSSTAMILKKPIGPSIASASPGSIRFIHKPLSSAIAHQIRLSTSSITTSPTTKVLASTSSSTSSSSPSPVVTGKPTMKTLTATPPASGTQRMLTVAQAQRMGLITSTKLREIVAATSAGKPSVVTIKTTMANSATTTTTTTAATKPTTPTTSVAKPITIIKNVAAPIASFTIPKPSSSTEAVSSSAGNSNAGNSNTGSNNAGSSNTAPKGQKIVIQTAGGVQRQVMLPPHLYKLAQKGQIKAVSIAGKGIQYVRVNNSNGSANAAKPSPNVQQQLLNKSAQSIQSSVSYKQVVIKFFSIFSPCNIIIVFCLQSKMPTLRSPVNRVPNSSVQTISKSQWVTVKQVIVILNNFCFSLLFLLLLSSCMFHRHHTQKKKNP